MGQMPLQGALGYAPQGQGVTGMDSQGSAMGAGSTAKKAAGFDGLFGSGFQRGGRIGRADGGGLGGLGMDPSQASSHPADLLKAIGPQPSSQGTCSKRLTRSRRCSSIAEMVCRSPPGAAEAIRSSRDWGRASGGLATLLASGGRMPPLTPLLGRDRPGRGWPLWLIRLTPTSPT